MKAQDRGGRQHSAAGISGNGQVIVPQVHGADTPLGCLLYWGVIVDHRPQNLGSQRSHQGRVLPGGGFPCPGQQVHMPHRQVQQDARAGQDLHTEDHGSAVHISIQGLHRHLPPGQMICHRRHQPNRKKVQQLLQPGQDCGSNRSHTALI